MRRPQGYSVLTDPEAPTIERDTFTCAHCQRIVQVPPRADPASMGGICGGCAGLICPACTDRRQKGGPCIPWEEQMNRQLARQDALRSYGL